MKTKLLQILLVGNLIALGSLSVANANPEPSVDATLVSKTQTMTADETLSASEAKAIRKAERKAKREARKARRQERAASRSLNRPRYTRGFNSYYYPYGASSFGFSRFGHSRFGFNRFGGSRYGRFGGFNRGFGFRRFGGFH